MTYRFQIAPNLVNQIVRLDMVIHRWIVGENANPQAFAD
tara:strand:+ start:456 stop:572 length:117 start_codon:yes stop_codon:yes gene_type:complete